MIDAIERPVWTESLRSPATIPASGYFGMKHSQIIPVRHCDMTRQEFERLMADGRSGEWGRLSAPKAA